MQLKEGSQTLSGFLAGKVWHSNLHPDLKPLAAALADIGNDDGTSIYPSVAYMAWLLGRSSRSVQINLAKLRDMGVLAVVAGGKGGRYKSTEYRLIESSLPIREPWKTTHSIRGFRKNYEVYTEKPRSLRHETTNPSSPEPLRTVSGTYASPEFFSHPKYGEIRRKRYEAERADRQRRSA